MKSKGARAFSAAALFLSVLSVVRLFAQGTNQVHEAKSASEHQLSEIVVSASRFEEEAWKSGSSISVVPDQQIRISRQTQTAETLRGEPGAVVNNNTGVPGGVSQISIRGLPFSRTLVDVDGLRLNRPIDNIANLTDLPPLALGNVELLRGPQSSLYGSEAEGGVVTVSTPRGKGAPSFGTSFEGGTFDTRRERLFSQGTESGFDWNVEYARLDTANQRPNNALRQDAAVVHLGYDISSSARVDWNSRWTDYTAGASDSVLGFGANDPDNRLMRRMLLLSPSLTLTPVEIWETRLTLGFIGVGQRSDQPPNTGFGTEFVNHSESQQLQWQNTIYATDWNTLVAGIEARREHTTTSFDSGNNVFNRATQAAYLSDSFRWEDWWGMTLSGRFDDNEGCRDVWTYRASQFFQLPETKSRLHMSFGTAFRSPTISELKPLFGPGSGENPNLVPETTEGYDAGMTQPLLDGKLELDSTYFYNSVVNLIETDSNFVFQNVSKMRTEGVENSIKWKAAKGLNVRAAYTLTSTTSKDARFQGNNRARIPRNTASIHLTWEPNDKTEFSGIWNYTGMSFDNATNTQALNSFQRVDLAAAYRITTWMKIFARGENLVGYHYQQAANFPSLGRTFYGGLEVRY